MVEPYYHRSGITIYHGDCREVVAELAAQGERFSAVVTDPPYGLSKEPDIAEVLTHWLAGDDYHATGGGFMGKTWDSFVPGPATWKVIAEKMLPGAHLAAFAGTRTYDLMGIAIRLAGLQYRETCQYIYGSGFPKSLDVSKAIDKAAGAEREVLGDNPSVKGRKFGQGHHEGWERPWMQDPDASARYITAPATDAARDWQGWGTALKPAYEPIILARRPLSGTVAATVLQHGTGALNIDASRVGTSESTSRPRGTFPHSDDAWGNGRPNEVSESHPAGRWPPNVILDPDAAQLLDRQSGELGNAHRPNRVVGQKTRQGGVPFADQLSATYPDTGGASRFFPVLPIDDPDTLRFLYAAKASRRERNAGLDGLPVRPLRDSGAEFGKMTMWNGENGDEAWRKKNPNKPAANNHPTVKPLALMRWLLTLVTPPGGVVLDPFAGSGSTGVAAAALGIPCILIEQEAEYLPIIAGRIDHALDERERQDTQPPLPLAVAD